MSTDTLKTNTEVEGKNTEIGNVISEVRNQGKNLQQEVFRSNNIISVRYIINEAAFLFASLNPISLKDKEDLVNYIVDGHLMTNKNKKLEALFNKLTYPSQNTKLPFGKIAPSWKLKYIADNKNRPLTDVLNEINEKVRIEKEKEKKNIQQQIPKKVEKRAKIPLYQPIADVFNKGVEVISDLRNSVTNYVDKLASPVKNRVNENLLSPSKKEHTQEIIKIYNKLQGVEKPDFLPFYLAIQGYNKQKSNLENTKYLTVVDYSKPVSQKRLYVINMEELIVEYCVHTGHGQNSGNTQTTSRFSNKNGSNQTSIGFFRTPNNLQSNSGRSRKGLFLNGLEYSNNMALNRGIAVHPVGSFFYASNGWNKNHTKYHKAGDSTSEGCITIRYVDKPDEIMDKIKGDSLIYSYYPDMTYLNKSSLIK